MAGEHKSFYVTEIEGNFLLVHEEGLMATITSKLPTEIKRFKEAMIAEIQAIEDLKVYEKKDVKKRTYVISAK